MAEVRRFPWHFLNLIGALILAAGVRVWLLIGQRVPFNGDEAIVALMARHINQGARPLFFYGQAYMGSLDPWLSALAFRLLGEQVLTVRVVQISLYLVFLITLYWLACRFFGSRLLGGLAVWIAAIPTVLVVTYTTASLGGYGETLVLGNLILLFGFEVLFGRWQKAVAAWLGLGLLSGLAFWTLGLAVVYILPVAMLALVRFSLENTKRYFWAGAGFLITSSPWWNYNLTHGNASIQVFLENNLASTTPVDHLLRLLLLGLPVTLGMRFPWSPRFSPFPLLFVEMVLVLSVLLVFWLNKSYKWLSLAPGARWLLVLLVVGFTTVFILSHFGIDATGRYFLPLYIPLVLGLTGLTGAAWQKSKVFGAMVLFLVIGVNLIEITRAAHTPDLLTTQFDPITRFDNSQDQALMDFLRDNGETSGYSNYWVSYRLAFLSGEQLIFAPALPYKEDLSYTPLDNRYPAYMDWADSSPKVAYITSKHPKLDAIIRTGLDQAGVTFSETDIGHFHLFFQLSRPARPQEIGLGEGLP